MGRSSVLMISKAGLMVSMGFKQGDLGIGVVSLRIGIS